MLCKTQTCIPYIVKATLRAVAEVELTSVPSGDARRTPRVDFNAQVELLARDDRNDEQRVLIAQALDLGAGGIGLSMRERLPVGTKVTCRLALDGRDASLVGRVAWSRSNTSPRPHGLGVCFDGLGGHDRELLAHVIDSTQAGYRPIELRFEGAQAPLIARACPTAEGLRVSTPLPMLNRGAELSVRFEGEGQAFVGVVSGVVVREEDGTRRLEVDLALSEAASVRFRRQARYGYADELASAVGAGERAREQREQEQRERAQREHDERAREPRAHDERPETEPERDDPSNTGRRPTRPRRMAGSVESEALQEPAATDTVPMRRFGGVLRVVASLLFAAACGALLSAWLERSWQALVPTQPTAAVAPKATDPVEHERTRDWEPPAKLTPSAEPAPHSPTGELGGDVTAQIEAPATEGVTELEADSTPSKHATNATSTAHLSHPTPSAEPEGARATPIAGAAPELHGASLAVKDGVTVVTVPYTGNLEGMQTRTWASPPAVAIDLPHGRALIDHGYYPLSGGIAAGVRVRERNQQLLVRVMLAQPVSRIAVSTQRESLEIRLSPAL